MATNNVYQRFVKRWQEVIEIPPQQLGPLTPYYKKLVPHLKVMPLPLFFLLSLAVVIGLYILLGSTITLIVSLLQRGF